MKALWILLGAYTTVWGFWLFNPWWNSFTPRAGLYDEMGEFMPEWAWGLHAIAIGLCILRGVLLQWPRGLWWGRIASTYHWGLIAIFYFWGDWRNTGALTALTIVIAIQIMWYYTPRTPTVHPLDSHH